MKTKKEKKEKNPLFIRRLKKSCGAVLSLSPQTRELYGRIYDENLVTRMAVWMIETGKIARTWSIPFSDVNAIACNGRILCYVNHQDEEIQLYKAKTGRFFRTLEYRLHYGEGPFIYKISIHPKRNIIILGAQDRIITLNSKGGKDKEFWITSRSKKSHSLSPTIGFSVPDLEREENQEFFFTDYTYQVVDILEFRAGNIGDHKYSLRLNMKEENSRFNSPVIYFDQHLYLPHMVSSEIVILDMDQTIRDKIKFMGCGYCAYSLWATKEFVCISFCSALAQIFRNPIYL